MKSNDSDEDEIDVSAQLGIEVPTMSDMISGRLFPNTKVDPKHRWFYRVLLIIEAISIIVSIIVSLYVILS